MNIQLQISSKLRYDDTSGMTLAPILLFIVIWLAPILLFIVIGIIAEILFCGFPPEYPVRSDTSQVPDRDHDYTGSEDHHSGIRCNGEYENTPPITIV